MKINLPESRVQVRARCLKLGGGGGGVLRCIAYTGMCRWTGYGFDLSVVNRVYNFRVSPKQGIARTIDSFCKINFVCTLRIQMPIT